MASGVITGAFTGASSSSHFTYKLIWSSTPNTANNRSVVNLGWYVVCDGSGWYTNKANAPWSWSGDGQSDSGTENFNYPNPQTLVQNGNTYFRSDTIIVPHNPNGTKSFTISGSIDLSGTSAGSGSLSGDIVLDRIATAPPSNLSLALSDLGTAYGAVGVYVAGFTKLRLTAGATAGDSPIASYAFYRGSTLLGTVNTSNTTATLDMTTYEPAGSFVYSVTVTDVYGLSATKSLASTTINAYTMPTITATTYRSNSSGTFDNEGTYGHFDMSWTVANVGSNSAVVHKVTANGTDYTTFPQTVSGFLTTNSYSAVYVVTDKLGVSATITQTVQVSFINFDLYPGTSGGVAFGEAAQSGKLIVNQSESIFRGDISASGDASIGGDLSVTGDISFANAIPIANGGTGATTALGALTAIGAKNIFPNLSVSSSSPVTITLNSLSGYHGGVIFGIVQYYGGVVLGFTTNGGSVEMKNLMTGATFSDGVLAMSISGDTITITSNFGTASQITVFAQ